ncbi:YwdI family protein [Bacillus tianshenii]|uniref:YwdI family protein n=1 Tax=Sutcliffiella tianshenii TaxID=1463404 RepID=UPI001CD542BF|nr:YwdI family protein [Bacillus tianshenii]MCA1320354.1 YwdI family protein [Bacillus tianshenii]
MSITLDKVLQRMQAELNRAQETGNVQKKREHLAAMKSLCELALEEDVQQERRPAAPSMQPSAPTFAANNFVPPVQPSQPVNHFPSKPMKEDEANGDSIFDF